MSKDAVKRYEVAVAAERQAFEAMHRKPVAEFENYKQAWLNAIKRTEVARAAMLKAWGIEPEPPV